MSVTSLFGLSEAPEQKRRRALTKSPLPGALGLGLYARAVVRVRDIARIEEELADQLAAPVDIRIKKRGARGEQGEIAIGFGSLEELNGILERLRRPMA